MTNLQRIKLELSNKNYYTDEEYTVFLVEEGLNPTAEFTKANDQIKLLRAVLGVLETLSNDVDLMRKIDAKDISSIGEASKYLSQRIYNIKNKIMELEEKENQVTNIRPLFFN